MNFGGIFTNTKKHLLNLIFWIVLSGLFNIIIFYTMGNEAGIEYLGGYILEMSLSLDNLFLFLMVFSNFGVKEEFQEKVLIYGVLGAMILRLLFILLGVNIIRNFNGVLIIFGIVLLMSGVKMILNKSSQIDFNNNIAAKILQSIIPITYEINSDRFFIKKGKKLFGTPLLVVLVVIEFSDIVFAIDSIPAIFSITTNTFIVYTSNIFAIVGLRSMYYILARLNSVFKYMKYGVGLILIFTGIKLSLLLFNIEISVINSILIIMIILLSSILLSLLFDGSKKGDI